MDRYNKIIREIPKILNLPGIYKFYDKFGNLIYIGKSINLRKRIYSYFTGNKTRKIERLVLSVDSFSYEVHDTHLEARLRECELIKDLKPHFNSQYKNDTRYLYLEIGEDKADPVIRHSPFRKPKSIGPFKSRRILEETIDSLSNLYPIMYSEGILFEYSIFPQRMNSIEKIETQKFLSKIFKDRSLSNEFLQILHEEMRNEAAHLKFERADFYKSLHDNIKYLIKSLDIKDKFENRSLILKINTIRNCKYFLITNGLIENVYYIDKWGNKVIEDKKFSILEEFKSRKLNDEKSLVDFRAIVYSELISNPENIIWVE
ncbi:GIY-YIG nuclease family protein [Microaceticoccus formicicus]|uniref:GIY-YIG nuclease family protein n=1 Tax=Microaceticoccus formicicus TaxID=3118105 RepID=UPI003CD0150B|nr:GIY-YIG nuclease family protein [Peptoniphilaceae bacterium AMB_02]